MKHVLQPDNKSESFDDSNHEALSHHSSSSHSSWKMHPRHRVFAKWYDRYMILIAFLASTIVYIQAAVILSNQSSENVSLPSYIIILIVSMSVMLYGILWTDWVIALSALVSSVGSIIALVATISYRPIANVSGAFSF